MQCESQERGGQVTSGPLGVPPGPRCVDALRPPFLWHADGCVL